MVTASSVTALPRTTEPVPTKALLVNWTKLSATAAPKLTLLCPGLRPWSRPGTWRRCSSGRHAHRGGGVDVRARSGSRRCWATLRYPMDTEAAMPKPLAPPEPFFGAGRAVRVAGLGRSVRVGVGAPPPAVDVLLVLLVPSLSNRCRRLSAPLALACTSSALVNSQLGPQRGAAGRGHVAPVQLRLLVSVTQVTPTETPMAALSLAASELVFVKMVFLCSAVMAASPEVEGRCRWCRRATGVALADVHRDRAPPTTVPPLAPFLASRSVPACRASASTVMLAADPLMDPPFRARRSCRAGPC